MGAHFSSLQAVVLRPNWLTMDGPSHFIRCGGNDLVRASQDQILRPAAAQKAIRAGEPISHLPGISARLNHGEHVCHGCDRPIGFWVERVAGVTVRSFMPDGEDPPIIPPLFQLTLGEGEARSLHDLPSGQPFRSCQDRIPCVGDHGGLPPHWQVDVIPPCSVD